MPIPEPEARRTFGQELEFLVRHRRTLVLTAPDGHGKVAVVPEFQGRVMTSTARGDEGRSHGFLQHARIAARDTQPRINVYGGEDRFWLGPEGGPFSLFFVHGAPQTLEHWQTPALIDTEPWQEARCSRDTVAFVKEARLANAARGLFDLGIERTLAVLEARAALAELGLPASVVAAEDLAVVAFESRNTLTNLGRAPWTRATGMPSIWILGMFPPAPRATVVLPLALAPEAPLGGLVNDAYFGRVPAERLRRVPTACKTSALLFRADGRQRGKIGVAHGAALAIAGSHDPERGVLTLVRFTLPSAPRPYVNSQWGREQREPFGGDVVNSYNDGPSTPGGASLGAFYELESSSPAAELAPGESLRHEHRTLHLEGSPEVLERVTQAVFGLSLAEIGGPRSQAPA